MANARCTLCKIPDEERTAIKITEINQFCLEHIFTYLDLEDLLNVADSNKYLKLATRTPFVRNYGGKSVHIDRWTKHPGVKIITKTDENKRKYYNIEKEITILDFKIIFQLLRLFGDMITDLSAFENVNVVYYNTPFVSIDVYHHILWYIYSYCRESLKKFSFDAPTEFNIMNEFKKTI